MSKYNIQKNIPIPVGKTTARKYPFLELEIGDSFSVPLSQSRNAHTAAQDYKRRYLIYTISKQYRTAGKTGRKRVRFWRVKPPCRGG